MSARPSISITNQAFTLIEMLVALAVLTLIIVFISQLTNNASRTVISAGKQSDADTQARVIFNRMAADFSRMLKRTDIDFAFKQPSGYLHKPYDNINKPDNLQLGNDSFAFYSETVGYFPDRNNLPDGTRKAPVSLVAYQIANDPYNNTRESIPVLRRMGKGLCWTPNSTANHESPAYLPILINGKWPSLFTDSSFKTIGDQVFRFEYYYLLKPTDREPSKLSITPWREDHTSIDGFRDVAAIVVTIAILDNTSRKLVDANKYQALIAALPDAGDDKYLASEWNEIVSSPNFASSVQIPKPAAAAVRVYERYFNLNAQ